MTKTAISVPDDVFEEAEEVAVTRGMSRSQLYVTALRVYLEASREDRITRALNAVYDAEPQATDEFLKRAARLEAMRSKHS